MIDFSKQPGKKLYEKRNGGNEKPLVSIITPFYNSHSTFEQTFNSVMNQTFPWFEWIIIDDGSSEKDSIILLSLLPERDRRIIVLHQENLRQAAARNLGIASAKADIIIPLDADDLISPTYLERTWFSLFYNPDAMWSYTDSVGFGEQEYEWIQTFSSDRMKKENILTCTAAIRAKVLHEMQGYTIEKQAYDEDWELWLRLLQKGYYPVHLPETRSFWYRRSSAGMQKSVQNDYNTKTFSQRMIKNAAAKVPDGIAAITYPRGNQPGQYARPEVFQWERCVYQDHNKINVLMLIPWMVMGGADKFYLDIVKNLDPELYRITVVTTQLSNNEWSVFFEEYTPDVLHLPDFLDEDKYPAFLSYLINSRQIDILFLSNSYYGYEIAPWLRKNFPRMAIIDYVHMEEWYWRNGGFARTSGLLDCVTDLTLTCNNATRDLISNYFNRKKEHVQTLYIGVDQSVFNPAIPKEGSVRKQFEIDKERPVILFPCRIHPQKRPFLLLEIAKEEKRNNLNTAFIIVGDGPQLEDMKIAVQKSGLATTVYFAGQQDDLRPFYKDATMTLICSLKEGLSLTAYESLAMGCPVISSDVGGQAELIDETVGKVIPLRQSEEKDLDNRQFSQEEINDYRNAIQEIVSNHQSYSRKCRERILNGFSITCMIENLEKLIYLLINDKYYIMQRQENAKKLESMGNLTDELVTLYSEIDAYEYMYKNHYDNQTKNELLRIANSKWGKRILKIAFKLKLNRLF